MPQEVAVTKVMAPDQLRKAWAGIYAAAGIAGASEDVKKSLRCAMYCYYAVNGTSDRLGSHGVVKSGKGTVLNMALTVIPIGDKQIRRFMRANAEESVAYHRHTGAYSSFPEMRAKCAEANVDSADVLGLCDWLDLYEGLTPTESIVQANVKSSSILRSRVARGSERPGAADSEVSEQRLEAARAEHGTVDF